MSRYNFDENEIELDDLNLGNDKRRFSENDGDQPRRSPIRRKDKMRPEERVKAKSKKTIGNYSNESNTNSTMRPINKIDS